MELEVTGADGESIHFHCGESLTARWVSRSILEDLTYPLVPFVDDVRVVLDIGANCGAFSVHAARAYPDAQVHAFEPAEEPFTYLERNAAGLPNVSAHRIGLHDHDAQLPFFRADESINGSVLRRDEIATGEMETVEVREAAGWLADQGLDRADIVKLDVEGCELEVLRSLAPVLSTVKVLYVEYDSREARREMFALLDATHDLYWATMMALHQGEAVFLRTDLGDHPDVLPHHRALFARAFRG